MRLDYSNGTLGFADEREPGAIRCITKGRRLYYMPPFTSRQQLAALVHRELLDVFHLAECELPAQTGMVAISGRPGALITTAHGGLSMGGMVDRATPVQVISAVLRSMVDTAAGVSDRRGERWQGCATAVAEQMPSAQLAGPETFAGTPRADRQTWPYQTVWMPDHQALVAWFKRRVELRREVDQQWAAVRTDFVHAFGAAEVARKLPVQVLLVDRASLTAADDAPESMGWNHWTEGAPRGDILIPDDSALDLQQLSDTLVHEAVHGMSPRLAPGEPFHGEVFVSVAESFVAAMATRRAVPGVPMAVSYTHLTLPTICSV